MSHSDNVYFQLVSPKVKENYVEGKGQKERNYLREHPERPISYWIVARKIIGQKGTDKLVHPVLVTKY